MTTRLTRGLLIATLYLSAAIQSSAFDDLKTWDGRHSIEQIEVTVVYFVPRDRTPLPDWRDRVDYFCRRIEKFHVREFQRQSTLTTKVHAEPFTSARTTEQLRAGDANFISTQTLREVDSELKFATEEHAGFPILLVLSEINWRPLEDFFRLSPKDGRLQFEGQIIGDRHFPGAKSGGSRATYFTDRGVGWGLVSADGWRVPYCGTDCVVYHEGVGHPVGLPHPQERNGSVMGLAQYRGWISESWVDDDQKKRLGWKPAAKPVAGNDLYSTFRALPEPLVPKPGESVALKFDWPKGAVVESGRVQIQTEIRGPWIEVAGLEKGNAPVSTPIGVFDRPSPVSYRVDVELDDGQSEELWGYFQVRSERNMNPQPRAEMPAGDDPLLRQPNREKTVDLLGLIDVEQDKVSGDWTREGSRLESPKQYGARIEIPYEPPAEYELTVVVEAIDEPHGMTIGHISGGNRFLTLLNHRRMPNAELTAIEDVDGKNVGNNSTTLNASLFKKNRLSQIICTVRKKSVVVTCDGRRVIDWQGDPSRLSLSDYWKTPNRNTLFLGAYDCRYRFYRATLSPISGNGKPTRN